MRFEIFTTPSLSGVRLHCTHWGDPANAKKLVMLHGGGANSHWWDHLAPALAERFHAIALDFRGHGDSDSPDPIIPGAFHLDLEALLSHLDAPDAVLVGHSMGARIALDHAANHGRTASIVAVDLARGGQHRTRRTMRLALAARRTYRSRQEAIDRYRFLPPAASADDALRVHIAACSVREEPNGRFGFKFDPRWYALPRSRNAPLEEVRCPVLLIRGGDSDLLTSEGARKVLEELPDGRLAEIPGAGHNVHLEAPAAVLEAMTGFL